MRRKGEIPDVHTYIMVLKNCSKTKYKYPNQIHADIIKVGVYGDTYIMNSMIKAYASVGYFNLAGKVFDEIQEKDVISWTALIDGYVKNGFPKEGLDCFIKMWYLGVEVDERTVVSVLCAVGMLGYLWIGKWIHGFYVECGRVHRDVYVGGALVDMYAKCGCCDDAQKVADEMPERNTVSWSALIAGYVQGNRFKEALLVFEDMLLEQVEPNQTTLSSVLTACAQLGALDQGRWVHEYIDKNELGVNTILGTTMIDMYAKCGCIQEAFLVFQKLSNKNVYAWTTMITGLAMHGYASSSLILFSQMLTTGVKPNEITLLGVLSACCHRGLVDEGRRIIRSMLRIYGIVPNMNHYGCMVDLLGRAGNLDEALDLIKSMPMNASSGVWGALFGACMIHKSYELGEQVGKHLIKLQPHHSGRYMLLANLYSVCKRWEEAAHVRKLMKEKGVNKKPGWSLIEVDGAIHEFIASCVHPQSEDIYVILDAINLQLKLVYSEPDITDVPFDQQ
ncbi:hypothetical protein AQUCO_01000479v1 [Aquilegia coerulea]|uniref:DYW domain-containing protein n=1 Tax=Aquilegia coerulea TaxID=218851 RepID=A0A2G5EA37_AQUCA|nr:hypothetical protein AQUCO_01000479v1 [Aquilegia coerulea]